MFFRLLLLFTIVPLVELWLLLRVSDIINPGTTILLVIVTGALGASVARRQGWQVWQELQQQTRAGKPPAGALLDGMMILVAGALLITPGILTDLVGFLLLVPSFRRLLKSRMKTWLKARAIVQMQTFRANESTQQRDESVIDAEYKVHSSQSKDDE